MYEITVQDVRKYLSSLKPEDVCGTPGRPQACLVSRALTYKYPGRVFHVNSDDAGVPGEGGSRFDLYSKVQTVVQGFDLLAEVDNPSNAIVTRQQAEEAMPFLKGEN